MHIIHECVTNYVYEMGVVYRGAFPDPQKVRGGRCMWECFGLNYKSLCVGPNYWTVFIRISVDKTCAPQI